MLKNYRCILITGASSGIGYELARQWLSRSSRVVALARKSEKLLRMEQVGFEIFCCDLSCDEGINLCRSWIDQNHPDLIIHCAGYTNYADLASQTFEQLQKEAKIHIDATLAILHTLARQDYQPRHLLNVASALAYLPAAGMSLYSCGKTFMLTLSRLADLELKNYGMRVLCACPGPVKTAFQQKASSHFFEDYSWGRQTAQEVALAITQQIKHLKPECAIGPKAKIAKYLSRILPSKWIAALLYRQIKKRMP
jgi:short-subunit dehydrogenase